MDSDSVPDLLVELEREIFQEAARLDHATATALLLVARRVHAWVEPVLWEIIIRHAVKSHPKRNPLEHLAHHGIHVRHLLFGAEFNLENMLSDLRLCPNVSDLALWVEAVPEIFHDSFAGLSLTRLSFPLVKVFSEKAANHPIFAELTHLEITNQGGDWEKWRGLAHLPKLTHLSLPTRSPPGVVEGCLMECKHLRILMLIIEAERRGSAVIILDSGDFSDDYRVVAFECDCLETWEDRARGRRDVWVIAEEIVARRSVNRHRDVEPKAY